MYAFTDEDIETVYPRVGGGNYSPATLPICVSGLSPRGRGKLFQLRVGLELVGSIPAWAGETPDSIKRGDLA